MDRRATHQPVSENFRRQTAAGTRTQLRITDNGIFAMGAVTGVLLSMLIVAFVLVIDHAASPPLEPGDRVCVEYVDADGYFCGPIVITEHGVFTG